MFREDEVTKKELSDDVTSQISGGMIFKVKCSCCGKDINYASNRWGSERKGNANFVCGYFCNECVEKFRKGEIKDGNMVDKFLQLDNRGNPDLYKPYSELT